MPEFARACDRCGLRAVEQLSLPMLAASMDAGPQGQPMLDGFDFRPEASGENSVQTEPVTENAPVASTALVSQRPAEGATTALVAIAAPCAVTPSDSPIPSSDLPEVPSNSVVALSDAPVRIHSAGVLFGATGTHEPATPAAPQRSLRREIMFVTIAATVSGVLTLALLMTRSGPGVRVAAAPAVAASKPAAAASRIASAPTAPGGRWIGDTHWTSGAKNSIAFELEADKDVGVWMRTVKPAFIVRCTSGRIEAFVFTASAAQIEPPNDDHTVQYSVDGGNKVSERWQDSDEHDALFAPDPEKLVRKLLGASTLDFGFTPHNAAPVIAAFSVAGLANKMESAKRQCSK